MKNQETNNQPIKNNKIENVDNKNEQKVLSNENLRAEIAAKKEKLERINLERELAEVTKQLEQVNQIQTQKTSTVANSEHPIRPRIEPKDSGDPLEKNNPENIRKEILNNK